MTSWIYLLLGGLLSAAGGAVVTGSCQAKLEVLQQENQLVVRSHCLNTGAEEVQVRYELEVERTSPSGTSRNTQGGRCRPATRQDIVMSEVSLSATAADSYAIRLRILNTDGFVISADSVYHTPAK